MSLALKRFTKRIAAEVKSHQSKLPDGIKSISPKTADSRHFSAEMFGPPGGPLGQTVFKLSIQLSPTYPNQPPTIRFVDPIPHHPNISPEGHICLECLKPNHWKPIFTLSKVLVRIRILLASPNPHDPLNPKAASLYLKNIDEYWKYVQKDLERQLSGSSCVEPQDQNRGKGTASSKESQAQSPLSLSSNKGLLPITSSQQNLESSRLKRDRSS